MTTSGTYSFNYNRDQIISSAARKLGVIAAGETLGANAIQDFADALNIMVKGWDASGIHIWTETEGTLFFQPNQVSYTIGGSTTDHLATSFFSTTTTAEAALGAGAIVVASVGTIGNGDAVGVVRDDGLIFWTTVSSVSGSTINLVGTLPDSAAALNPVYSYPQVNALIRPLRIVSGRRHNFSSAIDTPMDPPMSRLDYRALPNKNDGGTPTRFFYDPRGGANTQGIVYIWPAPPDATNCMNFTWWRPLQDFNAPGNTPDLPNEWINALIWSLAEQMAIEYDCPANRYSIIQTQAAQARDLALGFDREPESYLFGFNADQTGP